MTIKDIQDRTDLVLLTDSQEVESIKQHLGEKAEDFDAFFVRQEDGDLVECYGFSGIVPLFGKTLTEIV